MTKRAFLFATLAVFFGLTAAGAADLTGKGKSSLNTPNGDLEINFDFHVNGEKLTGTVTNTYGEEQITDGLVKGDTVSFIVLAGGGQFKITYKGTLAGDDLKFHVIIGEMGEGDLVAKRVK
jgi:hypothetical protein